MPSFSRPWLRRLAALLLLGSTSPALAAATPRLAEPPEGERWFSVNVGGERVGFAHQQIGKSADGYRIDSEGSVKMRVMGFSREAITREQYLVGRDMTLRSFSAQNSFDGSETLLKGEATSKGVRVEVETGGRKKERLLKAKGAIFPPQALNVYPLLQGAAAGRKFRLATLDIESLKVKQIKVEVIGEETLPPAVSALHLRNDLYPMVDNDIWVDLKGDTLKESVRDDLVVTLAEDEKTAKLYLADAALAKRDPVLAFSLIKVQPPLERPDKLQRLSVAFTGVPAPLPILQGKGQQGTRLADGRVLFAMPNPAFQPAPGEAPTAADLEPSARIPSDAPEIAAQKAQILGDRQDATRAAGLLAAWVASEIKGTVADSRSPLETLKSRNGNSQSQARLYAALARAAGIATRVVSGLIYLPGQGYLYHSWAESYLDGWVAVDPSLGEIPANLSHIKLVEGDGPDAMAQLAGMIGKLKAQVVEQK